MTRTNLKSIFALIIINSLLCQTLAADCRFSSGPEILIDRPGKFLQVQVENDSDLLWQPGSPASTSLADFQLTVANMTDVDPLTLLETQAGQSPPGPDRENTLAILSQQAGTIRKMNCLEGLLLARQSDRTVRQGQTMFEQPTEFLAWVLVRAGVLKIYYYTTDQAGIGNTSVLEDYLVQDRSDGWSERFNLHNHNFFPGEENIMGSTTPSSSDVQAYRAALEVHEPSFFLITNGFNTVELQPDDLALLHGPADHK